MDAAALIARLAAMLDQPEDATEDEVMDALADRLGGDTPPDPRKYVPVEALAEAMAAHRQTTGEHLDARVREKVTRAEREGYLTPAMRDWALDLCRADEAAFDSFVGAATPAFAHLARQIVPGHPPHAAPGGAVVDDDTRLLCDQLGLDPARLAD